MIEKAAPSKCTVFITGESGTGKELCAEPIHGLSRRAKRPFILLNCGAIPKHLMESGIFGHVKGAFTGAVRDREGAAKPADGGKSVREDAPRPRERGNLRLVHDKVRNRLRISIGDLPGATSGYQGFQPMAGSVVRNLATEPYRSIHPSGQRRVVLTRP